MLIKVDNINKSYKSKYKTLEILKNINFEINKNDFIALMGPSGSGKSTLLNLISGLDKADSGSILFSGSDICKISSKELARFRRDYLGFIFQEYNLIDTLTVNENIALALTMKKHPVSEIQEKIYKVMLRLNINELSEKLPYQLSGGEKQRVACARALIKSPKLILADEPTGALDSKSANELMLCFNEINENMDATILLVTHDVFTASYCNKVLFLENGLIQNTWVRGNLNRDEFFNKILSEINSKRSV
ncbi:ABC transporter ATP-binding protein [Clostridium sp. CCUG 7971]|uniref:ABC transporter ATP-binding protein n=1 Tax=Clostridium sp. CCUG 7971 TaxID=2811414 RepID=UPI001ABB82DB|nr:ABC transporter ATP-binding protein [Clostridium sp. CCUG 7971]MBO3443487.1 ABC transporter ATP-binding protein [Clostridium sp. CCUG 7971]